MKYHIKNERREIIASFVTEYDRGIALDALCEEFPDCRLTEYDD